MLGTRTTYGTCDMAHVFVVDWSHPEDQITSMQLWEEDRAIPKENECFLWHSYWEEASCRTGSRQAEFRLRVKKINGAKTNAFG